MMLQDKVMGLWFDPLRGVICLIQVILGMTRYNNRVSIVELLKNNK